MLLLHIANVGYMMTCCCCLYLLLQERISGTSAKLRQLEAALCQETAAVREEMQQVVGIAATSSSQWEVALGTKMRDVERKVSGQVESK